MSSVLPVGGFEAVGPDCRRAVVPSPWPPRSVAVFLIDAGRPWLVDAGAGSTESVEALRRALTEELGTDSEPAGIILSHSHLDHSGGLEALDPQSVIAHEAAADLFEADVRTPCGLPFTRVQGSSGAIPGVPGWQWILAEGHAPGHLLLWNPGSATLLAADQFLLGLKTPLRIADPDEDSFGAYLDSIDRAAELEPAVMLSGHTEAIREPAKWLDRERRRLMRQLERTRDAVKSGARTAEEVTDRTYGSVPGEGARQLLLREKLAALRHLAARGEICRHRTEEMESFSA